MTETKPPWAILFSEKGLKNLKKVEKRLDR